MSERLSAIVRVVLECLAQFRRNAAAITTKPTLLVAEHSVHYSAHGCIRIGGPRMGLSIYMVVQTRHVKPGQPHVAKNDNENRGGGGWGGGSDRLGL
jgi:hypothetical protein